ncbi:outer membrane protein [Jiella pacifica]|uniref:Outer membrane beta-barrel protein n=1 Tax=Jiella pacifica TaxID=2696469 RepID=A0A6N9T8V2_9HYPH|nr:outer membrane protein [Jiella pacifica]NDW06119.1 outer membrane beta-barrel protein [Jiella pacifica]
MKVWNWFGALASVAICSASGTAIAADLSPIYDMPTYESVPEVQPVEIGTGWYLRGDVGYQFKSDLDTSFDASINGATVASGTYDGLELPASASFSAGIGYKFNEFLRADATFGYWSRDVDGAGLTSGALSVDTEATAYELMANAYVDLGTYAGFTPYLGAGAGGVQVSYDLKCNYAGIDCSSTYDSLGIEEGSDWRFAYSLMAGVSYDVSQNLKFDLGYRFTDVDGGEMLSISGVDTSTGNTFNATSRDDGFQRHTIQAGIRYSLW